MLNISNNNYFNTLNNSSFNSPNTPAIKSFTSPSPQYQHHQRQPHQQGFTTQNTLNPIFNQNECTSLQFPSHQSLEPKLFNKDGSSYFELNNVVNGINCFSSMPLQQGVQQHDHAKNLIELKNE